MDETSLWLWFGFNLFVIVLLAFDLGVLHRKPRKIRVSEALAVAPAERHALGWVLRSRSAAPPASANGR